MATNRIPNNDGGIQPTLVTAKGDLIGAVAAGTPSRVGVGTDGQSLTADSTNANGVSWQSLVPTQTSNSGKYLTTNGTATSWGTVATGSMTLLSTTTLSGASTTISSIDQTYKNLYILSYNVALSANFIEVSIQPNSTSGLAAFAGAITAGSAGAVIGKNIVDLSSTTGDYIGGSPKGSQVLQISNYANTTTEKAFLYYGTPRADNNIFSFGGIFNTTSAISSIKFLAASGTFSGGTVLIYGVN